jgi:undecaprenyl-diphosphatase
MVISLFQALVYSIVQGIAEWLPISSSAHIAILQNIFGLQSFPFLIFLQFASILAAVVVFWKDIVKLFNFKEKENLRYWGLLIVALIPVAIVGYLFRNQITALFLNLFFIGISLMVSGILVYSTRFSHHKEGKKLNFYDSVIIGIFQAASALFRGITRSGSTISAGMYRGLKREDAVKFSFLIGIVAIFGASLLEAKNLVLGNISYSMLALTFIITFVISIFAIRILLRIVKGDKFYKFGVYDFILGLIVLIWSLIH